MSNSLSTLIPLGLYRHYKGKEYSVLGFAKDSETKELMVLYVPLYGDGGYWVRPLSMFTEEIELDGQKTPRFTFISPS
ncbi:MAG: DUF1653 domain-containing protein [Gammaproteobacteria bacterium]|jgi:cyclomaltodextrinase / maltogenic alpha-amylase / neopullulanase|nr:DUF1653 domain-containing protein [Gammaproteobacteria bacterium]